MPKHYKLIEKLGEGGCGVVFRAEQTNPVQREVAVKIIKLGMDTRAVTARFEAERQTLAMMEHPCIARIFDAGATQEGRPYFAMELVRGERITTYCQRKKLPLVQKLELFIDLCKAVQHAHQKGIIHRDIKPSNVLVIEQDGKPQPKVIDFGVAKATTRQRLGNDSIYTAFDQFVGTPAYMSPEQAGATDNEVDTRSDIYSLGILLYELLTDAPPFSSERLNRAPLREVWRIIREEDPLPPSTRYTAQNSRKNSLSPLRGREIERMAEDIRGDLDAIVMHALEKEPSRRYASADDMGKDLQSYLNNEPVLARPSTAFYRFQKAVRRNKLPFAAGTAIAVSLVAGLFVVTWAFLKESESRKSAEDSQMFAKLEAARSEKVVQILKEMLSSAGPSVALGRDTTLLREILDKTAAQIEMDATIPREVEAELRYIVGGAYLDLLQFDKSEKQLRSALHLQTALYGEKHESSATTMIKLAQLLDTRHRAGDEGESELLAKKSLQIRLSLFSSDHPFVAESRAILAAIFCNQQRFSEAELEYRMALDVFRRKAPKDPLIAVCLNSLGRFLGQDRTRLAEAEKLVSESLQFQLQHSITNTPFFADSYVSLGAVLHLQGKHGESAGAFREALKNFIHLYGPNSALLPSVMDHLAEALVDHGELREAEETLRRSLELKKELFPGNENAICHGLQVLIKILYNQQKWEEVISTSLEAAALRRKLNGNSHPDVMHSLHWAALAWSRLEKWPEVEVALLECLQILDNPSVDAWLAESKGLKFDIMTLLGEALIQQNKFTKAEPFLLASYHGLLKHQTKWTYSNVTKTMQRLVRVYTATGMQQEAAIWNKRLVEYQSNNGGNKPSLQ